MHKTCPVLKKKMSVHYLSHSFTGNFSNFEATIEIASLKNPSI